MNEYYYKYISGSKWILLTGEGTNPKDCNITWQSSDNATEDLRDVLSEKTVRSPVWGHVNVEKGGFKNNIYVQVLRIGSVIRLGYECVDYNVPGLKND